MSVGAPVPRFTTQSATQWAAIQATAEGRFAPKTCPRAR